MKLLFKGKTNSKDILINVAKFKLASGSVIAIDRNCTVITRNDSDNTVSMVWSICYLCRVDSCFVKSTTTSELENLLDKALFIGFEYEDKAECGVLDVVWKVQ